MIEAFDKVITVLYKIIKVILCVVLLTMVGVLMAHIIFRYVLNNSLTDVYKRQPLEYLHTFRRARRYHRLLDCPQHR